MTEPNIVSSDDIRAGFASALSEMYQKEVPQYSTLLELVSTINQQVIDADGSYENSKKRVEVERHGAIRLGTASELSMMRRLFAVMGMEAVGYYDLTVAGLPVHATGFRPLTERSLQRNPFRIFTSLLRLDLIQDKSLRDQAIRILDKRKIFTQRCIELIEQFETSPEKFGQKAAQELIKEALETFRWHETSTVDMATYKALESSHPLIADVVCFKGPHINHLTPRVLDIDAAQAAMRSCGLQAKEVIEGPPPRKCPILLRQTSFLALEEEIAFSDGVEQGGKHRARFGEIEQRGIALTPKGRSLYDLLLNRSRRAVAGPIAGAACDSLLSVLSQCFVEFPDNLATLRREQLAYFKYEVGDSSQLTTTPMLTDLDSLVYSGVLTFKPITYEDFLPASAAGIFRSNLHADYENSDIVSSDQTSFEKALGCAVHDEFGLYDRMEKASITESLRKLAQVSLPGTAVSLRT